MAVVTTRQLLEAGMHFGHQTRRWNPKMRRFILGERNGIYIIDLQKTLRGLESAYTYVRELVAGGGVVLFVGTKKQTQGPIATYAAACGMPYINERWLGGTLTNFATISGRTGKLREFEAMERAGDFEAMPKKEALRHRRELDKLRRNLGGIRDLDRLPDAVFVIDTKKEHIAVTEANKLGLPIVAVVDTNCDPDVITHVIPGNDDAIRSGTLMCSVLAEAVKEGRWIAAHRPTVAPPAATGDRPGRGPGLTPAPRPVAPARGAANGGGSTAPVAAPASVVPSPQAPAAEPGSVAAGAAPVAAGTAVSSPAAGSAVPSPVADSAPVADAGSAVDVAGAEPASGSTTTEIQES